MANLNTQIVTVTTIADGSATYYSGVAVGILDTIFYQKVDYDNGITYTITDEITGETLLTLASNVSIVKRPRAGAHDTSGVAVAGVVVDIAIGHRLKFVIAGGGAVKSGKFHVAILGNWLSEPAAA